MSGGLGGDCIYNRTERRLSAGRLTVSQPRVPLLLECRFSRYGAEIGRLTLGTAPPSRALVEPSRRIGVVRVGAAEVEIASVHRMAGSLTPTDMPVGYTFAAENRTVGAIDLTGSKRRPVVLPRDPDLRDAARAGAIALALFWDPGDTDNSLFIHGVPAVLTPPSRATVLARHSDASVPQSAAASLRPADMRS